MKMNQFDLIHSMITDRISLQVLQAIICHNRWI